MPGAAQQSGGAKYEFLSLLILAMRINTAGLGHSCVVTSRENRNHVSFNADTRAPRWAEVGHAKNRVAS